MGACAADNSSADRVPSRRPMKSSRCALALALVALAGVGGAACRDRPPGPPGAAPNLVPTSAGSPDSLLASGADVEGGAERRPTVLAGSVPLTPVKVTADGHAMV